MSLLKKINPFGTIEVDVPAGQKIAISSFGADDIKVKYGEGSINGTTIFGFLDIVANENKVYGPYDTNKVFQLGAGSASGYYDVALNPSVLTANKIENALDLTHRYFEDFDYYNANDWTVTAVEAGAGSSTQELADGDGGILRVTNDNANNDRTSFNKVGESFRFETGKELWFSTRFKADNSTNAGLIFGLQTTDTTPEDVTDGVFFYKNTGDTFFDFYVEKNGTATIEEEIVVFENDTFIELSFHYDGDDLISVYADGVLLASVPTTNLPDDEDLTVSFSVRNGSAVSRVLSVDYISVSKTR